jgi:hypothetical protein
MSEHHILADLLAHLSKIERAIAAESRSSDTQRFYRLGLLAAEHARTKRHIRALDDREEEAS